LEKSTVLGNALGEFVPAYVKPKGEEWSAYAHHLTAWERETTLDC
jgi:glutamine synthetase